MNDELEQRVRSLEAERCRPMPPDYRASPSLVSRWATPRERREALAEAIGTRDHYNPED